MVQSGRRDLLVDRLVLVDLVGPLVRVGWGWYSLSTVLDDYSRKIGAWKLSDTMRVEDVTETLDLARAATGVIGSESSPSRACSATTAPATWGAERGRDISTVELGIFDALPDQLKAFADMGAKRAVLGLPSASADVVLPVLDAHAKHLS